MADLKISALTAATTPLAGTEVLPIVQSSTTKQVSVANLTAGRNISAAIITSTGATSALVFTGNNNGTYPSYQGGGALSYNASGGFSEVNFWNTGSGAPYYSFTWLQQTSASAKTTLMTLNTTELTLPLNITLTTAAKGVNFTANTPAAGMTSQLLNWYEEGTWTPAITGMTLTGGTTVAKYTRIGRQVTVQLEMSDVVLGGTPGGTMTGLPFINGTGRSSTSGVSYRSAFANLSNNVVGLVLSGGTSIAFVSMNSAASWTDANFVATTISINFTATYFV